MKKLLLILMMLLISVTMACSPKMGQQNLAPDININGIWSGVSPGAGELNFEFKGEGNKLYGRTLGAGDSKKEIQNGKIKNNKISFEVPVTMGNSKQSLVYKGKVKSENEIELTVRTKSRGPRAKGFGEGGGGEFNSGFGGGLGGFGGVSQESPPFVLKRVEKK